MVWLCYVMPNANSCYVVLVADDGGVNMAKQCFSFSVISWTIPLSVFRFYEVLPGFEFRIWLKDLVATTQYCVSTIQDCVPAVVRYSLLVPCHVTDPWQPDLCFEEWIYDISKVLWRCFIPCYVTARRQGRPWGLQVNTSRGWNAVGKTCYEAADAADDVCG